ncbi:MAG: PEP/pyruvate-binding domain-containing protein [Candidatus Dormibacteraceae bacterium]
MVNRPRRFVSSEFSPDGIPLRWRRSMKLTSGLATLLEASEVHGGKADGLRKLGVAGFDVPDGLALSVDVISELLNGNEPLRAKFGAWLERSGRSVAVRSSAIGEDGQVMSYAGMFDSKLGVKATLEDTLAAIDEVSSSGSHERIESYSGAAIFRIPVVVQKMIDPLLSGVSFTTAIGVDGKSVFYSEWVEGLGDKLVSGHAIPSRIIVPWQGKSKTLERSAASTLGRVIPAEALDNLCDVIDRLCHTYEGNWDIEWSVDQEGSLWLLQLRPVTRTILVPNMNSAASPIAVSPGMATGPAFLVRDGDTSDLQDGDVLVAEMTDIDFVPAMKRASAIVTEYGGMLSHAAIVARELSKPCVVGVTNALGKLQPDVDTTVDGTSGWVCQSSVVLGLSESQEIDWRSLCFYDRGFEVSCLGHQLYVESLPTGPVAYTSEEIDSTRLAEMEGELRSKFKQPVSIVSDQKPLWFLEWQRFYQLGTVTYFEAMLKIALARWERTDLARCIDVLKQVAAAVGGEKPQSKLHELYLRELGAALHSLCWIAVEGLGVWGSYRDTLLWRNAKGIRYNELLSMRPTDPQATSEIARVLECLEVLTKFRNESYEYFTNVGAFTDDYFDNRAQLVEEVSKEQVVNFIHGEKNLDQVYRLTAFRQHDSNWMKRTTELFAQEVGR